ncbi:MAG: tetratricopeptide repeat protein [Candidatus Omnitrophica bacterium]|nr:tetratricopeptide repeat protein [Candidatus Omnitrophota bacterium]
MRVLFLIAGMLILSGCATIQMESTWDTARKYYIQGLLYETTGDFENALAQYKKSVETSPDNSFIYGKIARTLLKQKRYSEAEKMFLNAIKLDEKDAENYLNLGLTYYYMKYYEKAITSMEKGLRIKEYPSYRMHLCDLYTLTGNYEKAFDSYKILIDSFPSNFLLYYNSGLILEKQDKNKEAEEYFKKAIKLQPNFAKSYIALANIYEKQNNLAEAITNYNKAIEISQEDPLPYEKLVEIYLKQNNFKEAENVLTKVVKKNIQSSKLNQILGFISFQNKKYSDAEIFYKRALMIKEDSETWFNLGVVYDKMENKKEMEKCMRRAIEIDPNYHLALNYLGYSLLLQDKNIDEAFKMIKKAVEIEPENGAYLDSLGWAYFKKGNYKTAEKFLLKAQQKEKDPEIYEHLGYLYYRMNNHIKAIYWWARSQEISPKQEISQMIEKSKQELSIRKK